MRVIRQVSAHYQRLKVVGERTPVLGLSLGDFRRSYLLQRPVIHPLYSPSGLPLTEQGAHNCPHHRGAWVGHARVNGVNFFHEGPDTGWIVPVDVAVAEIDRQVQIRLLNEWRDPRGSVIARETRLYVVRPAPAGTVVDAVSNLHPAGGPLRLEPDMHAYMGVRVIDALDEDDGGRIETSEGDAGEPAVSWERVRRPVRWVDYSGRIGGSPAGVALAAHPSHSPIAIYARAYGSLFLNPTPDDLLEVPPGQVFRFGTRYLAHDEPPARGVLDALWEEFGEVSLDLGSARPQDVVTAGP